MSDIIEIQDLCPGDVLLYRGTSFISKAIQLFDGSPVSHASLYLGEGMIGEAVAEGLVERDWQTSFHGNEWVKAYRLENAPDDMEPVLGRARYYLDEGNRYGFEQLVILAVLSMLRKLQITPVLRRLLRTLLDAASTELTRLFRAGKEPIICSEFVYRAFDEAEAEIKDAYSITIPGMLPLPEEQARRASVDVTMGSRNVHPESLLALFGTPASSAWMEPETGTRATAPVQEGLRGAALPDELIAAYLEEVETGETSSEYQRVTLEEVRAAADRFVRSLYESASRPEGDRAPAMPMGESEERSVAYQYLFQAAADFVTPRDLYTTDSLILLGTIDA